MVCFILVTHLCHGFMVVYLVTVDLWWCVSLWRFTLVTHLCHGFTDTVVYSVVYVSDCGFVVECFRLLL